MSRPNAFDAPVQTLEESLDEIRVLARVLQDDDHEVAGMLQRIAGRMDKAIAKIDTAFMKLDEQADTMVKAVGT